MVNIIKLTNFWEHYSEMLQRITDVDPSLINDEEYSLLWSVDKFGIFSDQFASDTIIGLLTSSDILGEWGSTVFDYTTEEHEALAAVYLGQYDEDAEVAEINKKTIKLIDQKIIDENGFLMFDGTGVVFRYVDAVNASHFEIFDKYCEQISSMEIASTFGLSEHNVDCAIKSMLQSLEDDNPVFEDKEVGRKVIVLKAIAAIYGTVEQNFDVTNDVESIRVENSFQFSTNTLPKKVLEYCEDNSEKYNFDYRYEESEVDDLIFLFIEFL